MTIKDRLYYLKKKQVDLLKVLRTRGYPNLQPPQLSAYLNHNLTGPQADNVIKIADEIIKEWEME